MCLESSNHIISQFECLIARLIPIDSESLNTFRLKVPFSGELSFQLMT